jgi:exodeoxyribonuclease VII large subunit
MQRVDLLARRLIHPGERLDRLRVETAHLAHRLDAALRHRRQDSHQALRLMQARLQKHRPDTRHARRETEVLAARLHTAISGHLARHQSRLEHLGANLVHLSPQSALQRGYSLVRKADGSIVRASTQIAVGESVQLTFGEGAADAQVLCKRDD